MPLLAEAMRAYEQGVGTAEDIDTGARVGLNHPMGPLELADFIGLDVCLGIMRVLHEGSGEEQFRPPQVLETLVADGSSRPEDRRAASTPTRAEPGRAPASPGLRPPRPSRSTTSRTDRVTVTRSNGFARSGIPRASANSRSSGFRTSPLMKIQRSARLGLDRDRGVELVDPGHPRHPVVDERDVDRAGSDLARRRSPPSATTTASNPAATSALRRNVRIDGSSSRTRTRGRPGQDDAGRASRAGAVRGRRRVGAAGWPRRPSSPGGSRRRGRLAFGAAVGSSMTNGRRARPAPARTAAAAVAPDDPERHGQAEPGALAGRLRREERHEQLVAVRAAMPGPSSVTVIRTVAPSVDPRSPSGGDPELARPADPTDRLDGVEVRLSSTCWSWERSIGTGGRPSGMSTSIDPIDPALWAVGLEREDALDERPDRRRVRARAGAGGRSRGGSGRSGRRAVASWTSSSALSRRSRRRPGSRGSAG